MCKSIKRLRYPDREALKPEIEASALQFVRKVSGFHSPSKANERVFDKAVAEITEASGRLLKGLRASSSEPNSSSRSRTTRGFVSHSPFSSDSK